MWDKEAKVVVDESGSSTTDESKVNETAHNAVGESVTNTASAAFHSHSVKPPYSSLYFLYNFLCLIEHIFNSGHFQHILQKT